MLLHLLPLLLLGQATPPATALTPPLPTEHRILQLEADKPPEVHRLFIAPGVVTSILLDAPLRLEGVRVEGEQRFHFIHKARQALFLMPGTAQVGESFGVTLPYADEALPRQVELRLVVDDTLAERQVEVHRQPQSPQALLEKLKQLQARLEDAERELQQMRSSQGSTLGLTDAFLQEWMDKRGVAVRQLRPQAPRPGGPFTVTEMHGLRSTGRVAVWLKITDERELPHTIQEAFLLDQSGKRLPVLRLHRKASTQEDGTSYLVVEVAARDNSALGTYLLKLRMEGREALLTVGEVSFPPLP